MYVKTPKDTAIEQSALRFRQIGRGHHVLVGYGIRLDHNKADQEWDVSTTTDGQDLGAWEDFIFAAPTLEQAKDALRVLHCLMTAPLTKGGT